MKGINQSLSNEEDIRTIVKGVESGLDEQLVAGLSGSARSIFTSILHESIDRPILLVTHQLLHAQRLFEDLYEMNHGKHVYLYPVNELIASEMMISSPEMKNERIKSLTEWLTHDKGILIAPIAALKRMLPPIEKWKENKLVIYDGEQINVEQYLLKFINMGYERVDMVSVPGEFSVRGGIIDIYSVTEEHPVRIELFDDEIDSIRYFDVSNQRSLEKIENIFISPANEMLLSHEQMVVGARRLETLLANSLTHLNRTEEKEQLKQTIEHDIEQLKSGELIENIYQYFSLFYDEPASLLDYLSDDGLIVFDEMSRIQEAAINLDQEEAEWYSNLLETNKIVRDLKFSHDWTAIRTKATQQKIYFSVFLRHIPNTEPANIVNLSTREMQEFHGQMSLFKSELERWNKANFSVVILASDWERAKKIQAILADYKMKVSLMEKVTFPLEQPVITTGQLRNGLEFPLHKLVIVTENELFKQRSGRTKRKSNMTNAERIKNYQELKVGDYVVHRHHGIGKYIGIETLKVQDQHKDYLLINYSGDDKLFVPIDQIDLIQKYVGSEGKTPRLYKLGGTEWSRVKRRVQSSVEDIADELIKLYAERQAQKGHAFEKDSKLQHEFEQSFVYQETVDQLKSIEEIKKDMEKDRPMDRLLCGDVGYGKTEVALRAAFKAITEGKQVAFLVPTTILAQQHYQTVQERFQDYPISIGLLSRFRTDKQQKETIEGLKKGTIDIVIGTHRLLSDDVVYHDLGLLIVDEEQRFGVKHKEKIKQIKVNIDVLTLTATPIPRTLHMSMLGIRDLSIIETPPENRFPVQTYVVEHNPMFIKEAIEREMARNGQVFLLYNRVKNIEKVAKEIDELVEDAKVAIAHGQMNESELENVMFSFLDGEFDVLVSTTIIETGVDIPNVNTLIVYDADQMGLSQLYQLRGRVGRSNRVAYAYFTYRKDKILNEVAEKRLQAIKEFTELGSGFKIAMRDLSIRGAGNLLGAEQHGFIDSVGFDLYSQMLKEAIEARKLGKDIEDVQPFNTELLLLVDAYIPESYIPDEKQKIDMYKRFQNFTTTDDMYDLQDELIDRFGDYPKQVENLFLVSQLKMVAEQERIEKITETKRKIELLVEEERSQAVDGTKLFELANEFGRHIRLGTSNQQLKIIFNWRNESVKKRYENVINFIEKLSNVDRKEQKELSNV